MAGWMKRGASMWCGERIAPIMTARWTSYLSIDWLEALRPFHRDCRPTPVRACARSTRFCDRSPDSEESYRCGFFRYDRRCLPECVAIARSRHPVFLVPPPQYGLEECASLSFDF